MSARIHKRYDYTLYSTHLNLAYTNESKMRIKTVVDMVKP